MNLRAAQQQLITKTRGSNRGWVAAYSASLQDLLRCKSPESTHTTLPLFAVPEVEPYPVRVEA